MPAGKRVLDVVISLVGLLALSPLILLIALAVLLDGPGPVFFTQERYGLGGRLFRILKFRTMREPASVADPIHLAQTSRGNSRVTRLGAFLRRTSLDELPQLINVLHGEMSLVGPRAHAVTMCVEGVPYHSLFVGYHERHVVPPGITGWAQVNGNRGNLDTIEKARDRLEKDLIYVDRISVRFDLQILLLTVIHLALDRDAF